MAVSVDLEHRITALEVKVNTLERSIQNLQKLMIANFTATVTIIIALVGIMFGG